MRDKIIEALTILECGGSLTNMRAKQKLREALQSTADDDEPITAEWCLANGAEETYPGYFAWRWPERSVIYDAERTSIDVRDGREVAELWHITTRGRLRHLLSAMREDAT